jgi:hypothetical protein
MIALLSWLLALFRGSRAPPKPHWPFAIQSTVICGETGSGKTSGTLANLLRAWLGGKERPGVIFICSKADDARKYIAHCRAVDRVKDVVHVTLDGMIGCDPLEVTAERLLKQCLDLHDAEKGQGHEFFDRWASETRLHVIVLCLAAFGTCRIEWVKEFIDTLPSGKDFNAKAYSLSVTQKAINNADRFPEGFQASILQAQRFVCRTLPAMPDRQFSGIVSSASAGLSVLLSYPLNRLLALNGLHPGMAEEGKLIVVDLPVLEGDSNKLYGALLRSVFETCWISRKAGGRKILSIVDEAHLTFQKDDAKRLSVSREAGLFGVRLFQVLEVAQVEVGGQLSEEAVKALIEQCPLKVCHQLPVGKTSEYFSKLTGEFKELLFHGGTGGGGDYDLFDDLAGRRTPSAQVSWSETYRPRIPAWQIAAYRRGGLPDMVTECLVIESGKQPTQLTLKQIIV